MTSKIGDVILFFFHVFRMSNLSLFIKSTVLTDVSFRVL